MKLFTKWYDLFYPIYFRVVSEWPTVRQARSIWDWVPVIYYSCLQTKKPQDSCQIRLVIKKDVFLLFFDLKGLCLGYLHIPYIF